MAHLSILLLAMLSVAGRYTKLRKSIHDALSHVPSRHRRRAIREAQQALTDHLHTTRAIQYTFAEQISKNSIFSLSNAISKIDFSVATFSDSFSRFLAYHPIDELDFFYESIGIDYKDVPLVSAADQVFINQDFRAFNVACVLFASGIPWNRLGELYMNEASIFSREPKELGDRVLDLKTRGFNNAAVAGMCLSFPDLLLVESDVSVLLDALKMANELPSTEQQNVDFWYEFTSIIKVVYSIGVERDTERNMMDRCRSMIGDHSVEVLVKRVQYFCRLGVEKRDIVMLLLERQELLSFDLETSEFSVLGFLKHFGMSEKAIESVARDFPYVLGRNKMANLPCAMRAMDLQNWFFSQLKNARHELLGSYVMDDPSKEVDQLYKEGLEKIMSSSCPVETMSKLKVLHGMGFGENKMTLKMLRVLHTCSNLQESFGCFIDFDADYSRLCRSLASWPSMLRQNPDKITEKLDFFFNEMRLSWSYFYDHPECFDFDLDKRIKPRLKFYDWLSEMGLVTRACSLCKKIRQSDEAFVASVSSIHPATPKHYFESFVHTPKQRPPLKPHYHDLSKFKRSILSSVPIQHHSRVIQEAQQALADYLHITRSIQFTYAEQISKNSISSLKNVISKINFSVSTFAESFIKFLKCNPTIELDFFYESIGVDNKDVPLLWPTDNILIGEEFSDFNVACVLYGFGCPWTRLGELYTGDIFSKQPKQLTDRLLYLKACGFTNIALAGMCLAFPELLEVESERGDVDMLLNDLMRVYELTNDVLQDVDFLCRVFKKVKSLYAICFERGEFCNLTHKSRSVFVDYSEDVLVKRIEYFCKLGIGTKDAALLLLKSPEIIGFDLATPEFSVLGFLKHFGMSEEELESVTRNFPHVLGRNKMANLPCVMRALDLQNWFFNQMKNGSHGLLGSYSTSNSGKELDRYYKEGLDKIRLSKSRIRALSKLKFLHGLGFGENKMTMELSHRITGHYGRLQDRFNCFIDLGADYSKICGAIIRAPMILNSEPDAIKLKLNFLFNEVGLSMPDLYKFPAYLASDLDRQIKPRYRFHEWLTDKGLSPKPFSRATLITTKESVRFEYDLPTSYQSPGSPAQVSENHSFQGMCRSGGGEGSPDVVFTSLPSAARNAVYRPGSLHQNAAQVHRPCGADF